MHGGGAILTFDDRILVAGYYYNPNGRSYYGATYRFTTADHTCEGRVELVSISEDTFERQASNEQQPRRADASVYLVLVRLTRGCRCSRSLVLSLTSCTPSPTGNCSML